MKLRDLQAKFIRFDNRDGHIYHQRVELLSEATGVMFLCPLCFAKNGGEVGTHSVICHFEGTVPDGASPGPGRWTPKGTCLDDLTFVPGKKIKAVSVLLKSGCGWHGHVRNGDAS